MDKTPFAPVIRTQADVEEAWRHLMRPLGWDGRRLWFMFVGPDDRPLRQLSEVDDLPDRLPPALAVNAARVWRRLRDELAPGGRVALLLCRPGRGGPTPDDRASAAALYDACRDAGLALEVIHLATDEEFFPLPCDAVGRASA
jgi:hypothetical protein